MGFRVTPPAEQFSSRLIYVSRPPMRVHPIQNKQQPKTDQQIWEAADTTFWWNAGESGP